MIAGIFHKGSGLGDQLHRYVTVRTLAEEKGFEWGMAKLGPFKGESFMPIEMGKEVPLPFDKGFFFLEKNVYDSTGVDIRSYDPEINFVKDGTIIDGSFEDFKYWGHNLKNINEWLRVEPLVPPDDTCIIGFRGGEYYTDPDLGLPKEYWDKAIQIMKDKGINKFEVHTDDVNLARQFFPDYTAYHEIGINWRCVRYAKNLIIANSAFYILPSLLNQRAETIIAPRYWARRNTKQWARPACYYPRFHYI